MTDDKLLVIKFFKAKNIEARHFSKKSKGKKADFELYSGNHIFGYCELKSILDYEFSGLRHDPTYNKIQNKIHEAAKQFHSVNPNHLNPNIIFFINHTKKVGWQDLWYVLTGQVTPPNQPSEPIDVTYLLRLLKKDDLAIIDYFIWSDTFGENISFSINSDSHFTNELKERISSKLYENININDT
jgi:hypothetical protein